MYKRTSTPLKKQFYSSSSSQSKKISIGIQTDLIGKYAENISDYLNNILMQGKTMNDNDFEKFVKVYAIDSYWKVLAERARIKLDEQLQENRQLHELVDELTKENEELQTKNEQCEYLTNIFNSIISEYDSGIELHSINESLPLRQA
ncbi:unnamed protein product [Adineta steineri]|uniref:Uncharacterized protein n=1 Tax=Adineta steineri TaxID=433720 RepID=A0A813X777_9BILA|nr:unnamed protein product [Adineta steineri]CAF0862701.1 unnamed protein product [Adineta steineri]